MALTEIPTNSPNSSTISPKTVKSETEILSWLETQWGKARDERIRFEREWYINIAFYFGEQWVQWHKTNSNTYADLRVPKAPPWRVRLVSNKIKPIIRKEIAKLTAERPRGIIVPSSPDDHDILAASAGEDVQKYLWRELQGNHILRRCIFWMCVTGNGFAKDWYDPRSTDQSGEEGKINLDVITPFHIFVPDLQEETLEGQSYLFHVSTRSTDWVQQVFGKNVSADSDTTSMVWEEQLLRGLGLNHTTKRQGSVQVKEAWIKSAPFMREGGRVTWAGGTLLAFEEGLPYQNGGEYPITKFDHIPTGRFYSQSVIPDLIPLQKEMNRTRSQIIEAKNRMAKPQLVAARGSVDANKITTEPGLVIYYTPGFEAPKPIPLTPLPNYVLQEVDRNQLDMNDIASQHEIAQGQTPPGVEAATAISFLQEQDDSALSDAVASVERGVEKLGRHLLSHAVQYWEVPRIVRVTGPGGVFESRELKGSDLQGATDYRVVEGSAKPRSFAAKQAFIMELMKNGFIPPQQGLQYLDFAETDRLYEELQIDMKQVMVENLTMRRTEITEEMQTQVQQIALGIQQVNQAYPNENKLSDQQILDRAIAEIAMPVNFGDNHFAHIDGHERFMKSQEFKLLPEIVQRMVIMHTKKHYLALATEMGLSNFDIDDPRLIGVIRGYAMPPAEAVEDLQNQQGQEVPQNGGPDTQ